ncbi:E3 SUMO-protein ligase PIAS2-like isoform X3 [Apostichopus japonicus]|uniref:E3 SUMO-protein ligase PIAS2-like isoform X3 n=1 Tax=Stichopus japonicus TaxID=307972 RepID=UPI003AB66AC4
MASNEDLKHMVSSFRVTELQVLLGFAGRNKSGRKHELQQRALSLLEKGCSTPIQIKIKELYRRRFPRRMVIPSGPSQTASFLSHLVDQNQRTSNPGSSYSPSSSQPPLPSMPQNLHSHGFTRTPKLEPFNGLPQLSRNLVIHPDVHYRSLPFYDQLAELVKPSSLTVDPSSSKYGDVHRTLYFHLMPSQIQQIIDSKHPQTMNYVVQVQLRFCLSETSCEQEDRIPTSVTVKVNGKICSLPPCYPQNKPGVEAKRPGRPINITPLTRLLPSATNQIEIQWIPEIARSYCATVHLVRQVTSEDLLSRLKARNVRNPDHSRASIKEKLAHDPDSEIATTSLRVSLMCPLGKMRMQLPCRALTCTHLQCFDAALYLKMNERKPTWICPVCDKKAPFDQLSIDGLFMEILQNPPESNEIQFLEDGSWRPMEIEIKREPHFLSPSTPNSSSINLESGNSRDSNEPPVIDLTISSDSDSDSEDIKTERKHPHDIASALNFDLDQEIQRDLLQTPPVETQLSPAPGTPISDTPSIATGSPSSPVSPSKPGPSRSPQARGSSRLTDILDQEFSRQESSMPYPCSPLTDYHRGHLDSDREGVSLMPHRRLIPSPHHSLFADMPSSQPSTAPLPPTQVLPDYFPYSSPYQAAPLPQLSNADIGDLFSLLQQEIPLQQMNWDHAHHSNRNAQRSPGRSGPQDVIPLD